MKNYRPNENIWTIDLVMYYRPITENNFLKLIIRFLPFPVGNCCWVLSVSLSRFGSSVVLKQVVQTNRIPKSVRIHYTALTDDKQSSQKTMESAHGLQNSEGTSRIRTQKPVRILRKLILEIVPKPL